MVPRAKITAGIAFYLGSSMLGPAQGGAKDIYLDQCSICHGEDGAAKTAKGRKLKMKGVSETAAKISEADMIKIATDGKGPDMDGFGKKDLTAAQIKAVVEYYRSLAKK